jgi:hypothetical protein
LGFGHDAFGGEPVPPVVSVLGEVSGLVLNGRHLAMPTALDVIAPAPFDTVWNEQATGVDAIVEASEEPASVRKRRAVAGDHVEAREPGSKAWARPMGPRAPTAST